MELRVLGSDGGVARGYQTTSFLINQDILIDAGSAATTLTIAEQKKIDYIFISHSHLDHIKDIAFLADNLFAYRTRPIKLISNKKILNLVQKHLLNNKIWPDFTKLSNGHCPILSYHPIEKELWISDMWIRIIPVNHPVPAVGFIIQQKNKEIIISGDTGPTKRLWEEGNKLKNLQAILTEIAFPNAMTQVAQDAGHFTPKMFKEEIAKIHHKVPFYIYHLKPGYDDLLKKEIAALKIANIHLLKCNQKIYF